MNYKEAIKYISDTYKFGSKLGLDNITKLTELLGNPQEKYKIIHVAGTNGKGSTSNMIHDVLVKCGYNVGLFISPFLQEFNERIQINKNRIGNDDLARITGIVKEKIDIMLSEGYNHPTEFEVVTAIGFKYFEEQNIDFLVLEVGLGGRFDATNVIKHPLISVITSISYDHMEYLGDTLEKIAFEKAGIIKENSNVVIYPQDKNIIDVIKEQAYKKNSKVYETNKNDIEIINSTIEGQKLLYKNNELCNLKEFEISLLGEHQVYNCLCVLKTLELLEQMNYNISKNAIIDGLKNCKFAGRFEIIKHNPIILLDGGHNIDGIEYFSKAIKRYFKDKKIILFYGMLKDKYPEKIIKFLLDISKEIYTLTPNNPKRAMDCKELRNLILSKSSTIKVTAIENYHDIVPILDKVSSDEIVAFVGSLYLIGDIRTLIKGFD